MLRSHRRHRLEAYLKRLYGYAFSLTSDAARAEDLVHDTAVKALAARSVPRDEAAYRAWLFTVLRNTAIDRARRAGRVVNEVAEALQESEVAGSAWSDTEEVNALTVRIAFARLSVGHREILAAIDVAGLTYAEAASLFDVPVGTVMSRISRARAALYKHVEETTADSKLSFLPERRRHSGGR